MVKINFKEGKTTITSNEHNVAALKQEISKYLVSEIVCLRF